MPTARSALALMTLAVTVQAVPLQAQDWTQREFPLGPPNSSGNFVAPYFDGYYQNDDGTYTLSFGFLNRNESELVEIPLGPDNRIEPAEFDGAQPTSFPVVGYGGFGGPRERGAFAVVVPEDFEGDVWWIVTTDGYTTRVPGRLTSPGPIIQDAYQLSTTPQTEGSLRPMLRFTEDAPAGIGIEGTWYPETLRTSMDEPIEIEFETLDRGERELGNVNMSLWKHQGPVGSTVAFESRIEPPPETEADEARGGGGFFGMRRTTPDPGPIDETAAVLVPTAGPDANTGRFRATFDTPGEYVIRVKIDNFTAGDSSAGNQCCWSNGYVRVVVEE